MARDSKDKVIKNLSDVCFFWWNESITGLEGECSNWKDFLFTLDKNNERKRNQSHPSSVCKDLTIVQRCVFVPQRNQSPVCQEQSELRGHWLLVIKQSLMLLKWFIIFPADGSYILHAKEKRSEFEIGKGPVQPLRGCQAVLGSLTCSMAFARVGRGRVEQLFLLLLNGSVGHWGIGTKWFLQLGCFSGFFKDPCPFSILGLEPYGPSLAFTPKIAVTLDHFKLVATEAHL